MEKLVSSFLRRVFLLLYGLQRVKNSSVCSSIISPGIEASDLLRTSRVQSQRRLFVAIWRSIVYLTNEREISKKHAWSSSSCGGKRVYLAVSSSFCVQLHNKRHAEVVLQLRDSTELTLETHISQHLETAQERLKAQNSHQVQYFHENSVILTYPVRS